MLSGSEIKHLDAERIPLERIGQSSDKRRAEAYRERLE